MVTQELAEWQEGLRTRLTGSLLGQLKNRILKQRLLKVLCELRRLCRSGLKFPTPVFCSLQTVLLIPWTSQTSYLGGIFISLRECEVEHPGLHQLQAVSPMKLFTYILICILSEIQTFPGTWFRDPRVEMAFTTSTSLDQFHWFLLRTPDWFQEELAAQIDITLWISEEM